MDVSQRITNILNYYKSNPGCDPNMYEFVELCYDMVQYLNTEAPNYGIHASGNMLNGEGEVIEEGITKAQRKEQYPIPCAVYEKFQILSQSFQDKLLGNDLGITKESPIYELYDELAIGVGTYSAYGDTPIKAKLGGVALYIAQQKRDVSKGIIEDFRYDNEAEIKEIQFLNEQFHDPKSLGYKTKTEAETEWRHVEAEPSARRKLFDEIINEFQKEAKTR